MNNSNEKFLDFKQDLKNIEAKVIEDSILSKMYDYIAKRLADREQLILSKIEIELIGIRKFLMNLQIRVLSLENKSFTGVQVVRDQVLLYPDPSHLMCPKCGKFKFKGSESTDEHDTYLMLKCGECQYQYSPSHD